MLGQLDAKDRTLPWTESAGLNGMEAWRCRDGAEEAAGEVGGGEEDGRSPFVGEGCKGEDLGKMNQYRDRRTQCTKLRYCTLVPP